MAKMKDYEKTLERLQAQLVQWQIGAMQADDKVLVVLEGRDAAGKDGVIKRITEHLSPRNTRVAALPKPTDRQETQWYFQRYAQHLPAAGEIVIFNRSWYNRAGVEPVMGFCTPREHEQFLKDAPEFERMLLEADIKLIKYWLDISKAEQADRLDARRKDPLKLLKVSALDGEAQKHWKDYSGARDQMLTRTHTPLTPWVCVLNDHKKTGRINLIRHLIHAIAPPRITAEVDEPDPAIVFPFTPEAIEDGRLAR